MNLKWMILPFFSIIILGIVPQYSFAQTYQTVIVLDPIPSIVKTGQTVEFSGKLTTTNGLVVRDATIYIKDDVDFGPDDYIGSLTTDNNGRFSGEWTAQKRSSGSWDFYAVYEGSSDITDARSKTYTVTVSDNAESSYGTTSNSEIPTQIILDRLPSSAYAGNSLTFTGKLYANGKPFPNAQVLIKEDDPGPDDTLASARTDSNGNFRATWNISAGLIEQDFDIYAIYEGDSLFEKARSQNQIVSILKYSGNITLDSIPSSAKIGQPVTFSGKLSLNTGSPEGAIVYIKDEDPLNPDDLLATAYVDSSGRFSATWIAREVDEDSTADIYAVFEGNDVYYRLTTCDSGPTRFIGGSCSNTIPMVISGTYNPPPSPPRIITGEYIEGFYSLDFSKTPVVAIVPAPDSYNEASRHVTSVKEGVLMWKSHLDTIPNGNWNVDFVVVSHGDLFFSGHPDVIINLVTPDMESGCNTDFSGITYTSTTRPVQASVCVSSNGRAYSPEQIAATSAHEFIHAMGLGHAWNKQGDLMCSYEIIDGKKVYTCPNYNLEKSKVPSELDLAGVVQIYGTDGFKSPNNSVSYKTKFVLDSSTSFKSIEKPQLPTTFDYDNDGIPDASDKCVGTPENFNGYLDTDGCPDEKPTTQVTIPKYTPPQPSNSDQNSLSNLFKDYSQNETCGFGETLVNGYCVSNELAGFMENDKSNFSNTITLSDGKSKIPYRINGATLIDATRDYETFSLLIHIDSKTDGSLQIDLPRDIIDAKKGQNDDEFFVLVDGDEIYFTETKESEKRTLDIQFAKGNEEIEIIGTSLGTITKPKQIPAPFVDLSKDPKSYINRYIYEDSYRDWFGKNYPEYTFYEALGIPQKQFDYLSEEIMKEESANQDTVVAEKVTTQCDDGTHLEKGLCVADKQQKPSDNEKDVFSKFIDMIMSLFS